MSMSTTVTREYIAERIARLQSELDEVKKAFDDLVDTENSSRPYSFADLAGYFKDYFGDLTLEEIKEFEYKSKLDQDFNF